MSDSVCSLTGAVCQVLTIPPATLMVAATTSQSTIREHCKMARAGAALGRSEPRCLRQRHAQRAAQRKISMRGSHHVAAKIVSIYNLELTTGKKAAMRPPME